MKFNPLSLKQRKYSFEFSQIDNVETEKIKDPSHLICWVEEENARFIDENSTGSVLVIKRKKKRVIYAQLIKFPMASDTDFDELLDPFYTKKKFPFDESLLKENDTFSPAQAPAAAEPLHEPEPVEEASDQDEGYAPVPEISGSDQLTQLLAEKEEQQKEIERLQQLQPESPVAIPATAPAAVSAPIPHQEESPVPEAAPTMNESLFKPELTFKERLDLFIEQEKQRIEAEIAVFDNRLLIQAEVTARLETEKEAAVNQLEMALYEKRAAAIEKEEQRHKEELEKIDQDFDKQVQSKTYLLGEKYKQKISSEIKLEYNRQTQELKRIFDERMTELRKRQTQLSTKLIEDVKAAFSDLDLITEEPSEPEKNKIPVIAELKPIRVGE